MLTVVSGFSAIADARVSMDDIVRNTEGIDGFWRELDPYMYW
jgi:hypothetical protein